MHWHSYLKTLESAWGQTDLECFSAPDELVEIILRFLLVHFILDLILFLLKTVMEGAKDGFRICAECAA